MKHWPFTVTSDGGKPKIQVEYKGESKKFAPEEVSSMVLTKMKEIAETYLGRLVGRKRSCRDTLGNVASLKIIVNCFDF